MTTKSKTVASSREKATPKSSRTSCDDKDDTVEELPPAAQKPVNSNGTSIAATTKRAKHSKKLSLSFPILVPGPQESPRIVNGSASTWSQSPTAASPYRTGTPSSSQPYPSPDELQDGFHFAEGPDFLTLIAGQERRVMELKEELSKAESFLLSLKRQWAIYEAKKKQSEMRSKNVKLGPVSPKSATTLAEDEEAERAKRREVREQKMRELGMTDGDLARSTSTNAKKSGGRVFAGRHTRTLSLLQNHNVALETGSPATRPKSRTESSPAGTQNSEPFAATPISSEQVEQEDRKPERQPLSRQPTLQELIANSATGAAQINFGKTYKELASASRKSLPPGTDIFVKQGKQVYDGVSQGFWNFVEDIRQATVGDEAVHGAPVEQRREVKRSKSGKTLNENQTCDKHGKGGKHDGHRRQRNGDDHKPEKDNFWKEFGLETPKNQQQAGTNSSKKTSGGKHKTTPTKDHESKSSTDSKCPPSLLVDLMDVNEDDEAWDNWPTESPVAKRRTEGHVAIRRGSEDEDEEDDSLSTTSANPERQFSAKDYKTIETSWNELMA